jgi:hypothetical protein
MVQYVRHTLRADNMNKFTHMYQMGALLRVTSALQLRAQPLRSTDISRCCTSMRQRVMYCSVKDWSKNPHNLDPWRRLCSRYERHRCPPVSKRYSVTCNHR